MKYSNLTMLSVVLIHSLIHFVLPYKMFMYFAAVLGIPILLLSVGLIFKKNTLLLWAALGFAIGANYAITNIVIFSTTNHIADIVHVHFLFISQITALSIFYFMEFLLRIYQKYPVLSAGLFLLGALIVPIIDIVAKRIFSVNLQLEGIVITIIILFFFNTLSVSVIKYFDKKFHI